jgi:hypothetical protein
MTSDRNSLTANKKYTPLKKCPLASSLDWSIGRPVYPMTWTVAVLRVTEKEATT